MISIAPNRTDITHLRFLNSKNMDLVAIDYRKIPVEVLHSHRPLQIYRREVLVLTLSKSDERTYLLCKWHRFETNRFAH